MAKAPNKFLAPVIIAGITVGFLASARRFIFAKSERTDLEQTEQSPPESEKNYTNQSKNND
ncbi:MULTISPECIES: hypothetical protein [unclassified Acinetobacter]|uniref:hypothetical protein n=1 Tax=unclassified Acinetobacter TaxID=196816 RepID=UPI0015D3ED5D|nr:MULTISPECIES: hypothetical protein [unclassified Acinetobacter]UUS58334.1 hypothetical protein MST16_03805 [Acinetobacter sp. YH16040_T]